MTGTCSSAIDGDMRSIRQEVNERLTAWYAEKRFDAGNGEKILKRLMGQAIKFNIKVSNTIVDDCLLRRPALRETIYRYMCFTSPNLDALHSILSYLESDFAVDDASYVEFANCVVDSTCRFDEAASARIDDLLLRMFRSRTEPMLYSAFTIVSKLGNLNLISKNIESSFGQWKSDYLLGRVIGSLWPLISGSNYEHKFLSLIAASRNIGAREVVTYLTETANDRDRYMMARSVVKAPNGSFPNRISHRKFIVLRSILSGRALDRQEKEALRRSHRAAAKDPYYVDIISPPYTPLDVAGL